MARTLLFALVALLWAVPLLAEEGCPINRWLVVSNFTIANDSAGILVSADLASLDPAMNPAAEYQNWEHPEDGWQFDGILRDENGKAFLINGDPDSVEIFRQPFYEHREAFPLTVTPVHLEFRFPASAVAPGRHLTYRLVFKAIPTGPAEECWQEFSGKVDLIDPTPARRVSLGSLKVLYR